MSDLKSCLSKGVESRICYNNEVSRSGTVSVKEPNPELTEGAVKWSDYGIAFRKRVESE